MKTAILKADRPEDVAQAAELLREGGIIAFPTETVYGLGALADNEAAVAALCALKQRPPGKPFTLMVASAGEAARHGEFGPAARALAEAFWPGPLTLVVPDGAGGTVGLRCPDSAAALDLLRRVGAPLAAPSANLSGLPPATSAEQALSAFNGRIPAVLDGGPVALGVASTVVRAAGEGIEILREGAITEAALQGALSR